MLMHLNLAFCRFLFKLLFFIFYFTQELSLRHSIQYAELCSLHTKYCGAVCSSPHRDSRHCGPLGTLSEEHFHSRVHLKEQQRSPLSRVINLFSYAGQWPVADTGGGSGGRNPPLRAKHEYHYYATCL